MYDVKLPPWTWFEEGETYSGSLCPDPMIGSLQQTTMQYKACRMQDRLVAWCWFELPWNTTSAIDETVIGRFEGSSFGVETAEHWIRSKFLVEPSHACLEGGIGRLCG